MTDYPLPFPQSGKLRLCRQSAQQRADSGVVNAISTLKVALEKVAAFDRLDDRWQALLMRHADVFRSEGTLHAVAFQLPIHRRQPFEKAVIGIAGLVVSRKGHADG
jgi:hypothetical protein